MIRSLLAALLAVLTVVLALACAVSPPAKQTAPVQAPSVVQQIISDTEPSGTLRLTINWPKRDFAAAAIPVSANSVGVFVKQGTTTLHQVAANRPADGSPTTISIRLKIANNLIVEVKAYSESNPDLATATAIAQGSAAGVNIVASKLTAKAITLAPLTAPTITGISPNPARPGDTVTITGANLGVINGATPSVAFEGSPAASVVPAAGALTVVLPQGAVTGNVVITSDGLSSVSNAILFVASGLVIDAPKLGFDKEPATVRLVRYGQNLQFTATPTFVLANGKNLGDYGPPPSIAWQSGNVQGAQANTIDASGLFTAASGNFPTPITARLGSLTSNAISANPVGVDGIVLSALAVTVNAFPLSGSASASWIASNSATVTASANTSLPFNGGVTWTLSDPTLISANPSTTSVIIRAVNGAPKATAVLTATAVDDDRIKATASVTVTNLGGMLLEVE